MDYGDVAAFHVLDTHQYRSNQVCGDGGEPGREVWCPERDDPQRTITGQDQERSLLNGLGRSAARWNVIAQQVFVAQRDFDLIAGELFAVGAGALAA